MRTPSDLVGNDVSIFDLINFAAANFTTADEERSDKQNIKWVVVKAYLLPPTTYYTPIANKQINKDRGCCC